MKSIEDFKAYYEEVLEPELRSLDRKRKGIIFKAWASVVVCLILLAGTIYMLMNTPATKNSVGWPILATLLIGSIAYVLYTQITSNKDFYLEFKRKVIEQVVKFIHSNLIYINNRYVPPTVFVQSKLFPHLPKKYLGDDYVGGQLTDDIKIESSEVEAYYKDEKGNFQLLFHGIFFAADIHQSFNHPLFIFPSHVDISQYPESVSSLKEFQVEDEEFGKFFKVYCEDPDIASRMLTKEEVKQLVQYKHNHPKNDVYVSFLKKQIYVAISYQHPLFEPKLYKSVLNLKNLMEYYEDFYSALLIVQDIYKSVLNLKLYKQEI